MAKQQGREMVNEARAYRERVLGELARRRELARQQIEQLVRISREFGREVASAKEAREICKIGVFYDSVEETLAANGFAPNRNGGQQGYLRKAA